MVDRGAVAKPEREPPLKAESERFPAVLIFGSEIPQSISAGSILLYRLFQSWPVDRLLVVGPAVPKEADRLACKYIEFNPSAERLDRSRFAKLSRVASAMGWRRSIRASTLKQITSFHPEVIITVMQSISYFGIAYQLSFQAGIPLILFLHDDPEDFDAIYAWAKPLLSDRNRTIYRHAARRLCVSPEMRDLLEQRYGVVGDVLYPNRSELLLPRPFNESLKLKCPGILTLGYTGGLTYGYGARLEQLVPAFRDASARLRIYSRDRPKFSAADVMTYLGKSRSPEEVMERAQAECDALILPYCYAEHGHQDLYRTHFPSKLTEYLASGMPIIMSGPLYATGVKWALRHPNACVVITESNLPAWIEWLTRLRIDGELRMEFAKAALAASLGDFDPVKIRHSFIAMVKRVSQPDLLSKNKVIET